MSILIIYHSQSGNTAGLAREVARGVQSIEGMDARIMPAAEATLEDLATCQALAVGSPEYFGYMAGQVKDFFDRTYEAGQNDKRVFRKPYAAFISAGNDGRGALAAIERILIGFQLRKVQEAVIVRGAPKPDDLEHCYELGATLAAGCQLGIYN
jgi:multimeric flavodoxin WrbA